MTCRSKKIEELACTGQGCPVRERCVRYYDFIQYTNQKYIYNTPYKGGLCDYFKKI